MLGRDRENRRSKLVKSGGVDFLVRRIHLVHRDEEWFARRAKQPREFGIERRWAGLRIDNENQHSRPFNGHLCLAENLPGNKSLVIRNDAARVHHLQRATAPFGPAINAVACDAGFVRDDRATSAG